MKPKRPTHPELVTALLKPGEAIIASLTPTKADALHNAVGISGEIGEIAETVLSFSPMLDRTNLIEELGDLHFYLEGLCQNYDHPFQNLDYQMGAVGHDRERSSIRLAYIRLSAAGGAVLDLVKKEVYYEIDRNTPPKEGQALLGHQVGYAINNLVGTLCNFVAEVNAYAAHHYNPAMFPQIKAEEVVAGNIDKLLVRYEKGTFDNESARARADKDGPQGEQGLCCPAGEPGDPGEPGARLVEEAVIAKIRARGDAGLAKYGQTMDRTDLTDLEWAQHAQEEMMDGVQYLERIIMRLQEGGNQ